MNPVIIDLIIVIFVLLTALRGRHRGFVLTLCGFLTLFVAFIGAGLVSSMLAEPVAELLRPAVERLVLQALESQAVTDLTAAAALPLAAVLSALEEIPYLAGLGEAFRGAVESGAVELAGNAALALARFAAVQLARIALFLLAFLAVLIVWWVLSHALDLAFHLPGLNFLNRTGGLLLGAAQGIAVVFILCWLLRDSYLTPEMIDGSFLLPYFTDSGLLLKISTFHS